MGDWWRVVRLRDREGIGCGLVVVVDVVMVKGVVMGKDSGEWIDGEVEKCASRRKRGGKSRQQKDMGDGEKGAAASKDHDHDHDQDSDRPATLVNHRRDGVVQRAQQRNLMSKGKY